MWKWHKIDRVFAFLIGWIYPPINLSPRLCICIVMTSSWLQIDAPIILHFSRRSQVVASIDNKHNNVM